MTRKLVVIGAGMASGRVLEHLTDAGADLDITLFNGEPRGNYNRIMLSPVLSGEKTYAEIVTHDDDWYAARGVKTRFGEHVTKIDRDRKLVISKSGETPYDDLIIATGSAPFIIPVAGKDLPGVVTYRDLEDTNAMIAAAKPGATRGRHRRRLAGVGGGSGDATSRHGGGGDPHHGPSDGASAWTLRRAICCKNRWRRGG